MRLVAVSAVLILPWGLDAQITRYPRFEAGIFAGGSLPVAESRDSANAGYHVGAIASTRITSALDVSIDVTFSKLGDKTLSEGATFREVGTNVLAGTTGLVIHPRVTSGEDSRRPPVSPYVLAGVGAYHFRFDYVCRGVACTGPERDGRSEVSWGFHAGAGATMRVIGVRTFLQVSYHAIPPTNSDGENTTLLQASFGLKVPAGSK